MGHCSGPGIRRQVTFVDEQGGEDAIFIAISDVCRLLPTPRLYISILIMDPHVVPNGTLPVIPREAR
jgi:hypothetical protein